jgi:hypothetical protein
MPRSPFPAIAAAPLVTCLVLLAGCAGSAPIRTAGGEAAGLARPSDCPLELLYKAPDRPYEPLGDLQIQVMQAPAGGAVEALRPRACALGADAVIVTRNQVLNVLDQAMVEGTAIRWRLVPATPPAQ